VIVIGRTPARVTTSQRVTPSTTPRSGGLVVLNAYHQAAIRSARARVVVTVRAYAALLNPFKTRPPRGPAYPETLSREVP
jgi:hypothetical protein